MENKSLKQIIANRLEKLDKIRQLGVNPYPYEFNITHSTSEITKDNIDQNVSVAGRVMSLRKMGKAALLIFKMKKVGFSFILRETMLEKTTTIYLS